MPSTGQTGIEFNSIPSQIRPAKFAAVAGAGSTGLDSALETC